MTDNKKSKEDNKQQKEEIKEQNKQEVSDNKQQQDKKQEAKEEGKQEGKQEVEKDKRQEVKQEGKQKDEQEKKQEETEPSGQDVDDIKAEGKNNDPEKSIKDETPETQKKDIEKSQIEKGPKKEDLLSEKKEEELIDKAKDVVEKDKEEFDWETIGKKLDIYSDKEREKLEKLYDKTLSSVVEHDVVDGTVVAKNDREVVVNIGFKSDGVIPLSEFRYNPDLKVGDKVEVYVENQEDPKGQLILSHKKARILKAWDRINEAFDNEEIINGYVKCRTKGGLIVEVFGLEAFLPGSQIDVRPIRDYDVFVGKTMEFKVVKINHEFKNVVVSHKALIEHELEQQKSEIMTKLEKGQVLEGTVKNITSYGVFIDLGGVDGLIHITDLSWGRINHPEEIVELDQKIKVVILDFDDEKKRIALGLKQLTPHPWDALDPNLKVGDKVKGKVVVIADYGAFIEIAPGVEGLIHVSEMSWSQHLRTAQDFLKVGDEVEGVILTLDREERKMSLGMKQLIPDPWENIEEKYPKNSKHKAKVMNFTNFGIFVELEEGVDGLIHISDLSWSKKIKHPAEFTKIGEEIEVVVLDVDVENRRLSLGHKQLEENPWDVFESIFTVNSMHKGTITEINDKGAVVALPYGVEGFAPNRHLRKQDKSTPKVDETLEFKVLEFSKENKKIILSHTKIYEDEAEKQKVKQKAKAKSEKRTANKAVRKIQDKLEKTTLGDLDALASLKEEMEASEKKDKTKKKAAGPQAKEPEKTKSPTKSEKTDKTEVKKDTKGDKKEPKKDK